MKLACDICGGELQMSGSNEGASCVCCGMNYSIESLRNKLNGQQNLQPCANVEKIAEPVVQADYAEEEIPFADVMACEADDVHTQGAARVAKEAAAMRTLVVERKFDLQALAYAVVVVVDGEECAVLGSKGGSVSVPVSQGSHEVSAIVKYGNNKVEAVLEPFHIQVSEYDWHGLFYVRRTAWNAYWQMELMEDSKAKLMTVEDVFSIAGRGVIVTGTIESGAVCVNETVIINGKAYIVAGLENFRKMINTASEGMGVGMLLKGASQKDFKAGDVVYKSV